MLPLLPYIDQGNIYDTWLYEYNVMTNGLFAFNIYQTPLTEISVFYCPTRRGDMKAAQYTHVKRIDYLENPPMTPAWNKGGNDYSACIGSGESWDLRSPPAHLGTWYLTSAEQQDNQDPPLPLPWKGLGIWKNPDPWNLGLFNINSSTAIRDVTDGTSNCIMIAENLRLNNPDFIEEQSFDGWAWGGPATMFSTRLPPNKKFHFDNCGSEHSGGIVQAAMADGSVQVISENIDLTTFQNLGNMSNGLPVFSGF
jgi:prepilin-type processing-associated H-X9-DG protein